MQLETSEKKIGERQEKFGKPCPVCQEKGSGPLFVKQGNSFSRCPRCRAIYQDPPPSLKENEEFYQKGYYESFGGQVDSIHEGRLSLYKNILSECSRYRETGWLLDIGSGYGDFLKEAQAEGWEAWGIEPSRQASESAQKLFGLKVLNQTLTTADFPDGHFDVITLWNVIDCLPEPVEAVRKIRQWLSPGGLLILRTPNAFFHFGIYRFYSRFRPLLEKIGWKKEASVFLRTNFEAKTLRGLLRAAGFENSRIQNGELTQGDAYQVFSSSHWMRAAKSALYAVASLIGFLTGNRLLIGSNLIVRASKAPPSRFRFAALQARIVVKRIVLHGLAVLGYLLGLPLWKKWLGRDRELQILLYHRVNASGKGDMDVQPRQFERQMDFLSRHFAVLGLEEAVRDLKRGKLPERPSVALTFDDGYEDNYRLAFPVLQKRNLTATIFLLTPEEGSERKASHLGEESSQDLRLLQWSQIREMAASGFTFGSHGVHHLRLKELSGEKLSQEICESKRKIEGETASPVLFFSYPYGTGCDFDQRAEVLVREGGYDAAFSAIFGTNGTRTNPLALRRVGIEASDTLFTFQAKLNGALDLLALFDFPPIRQLIRWFDSVFLKKTPLPPKRQNPLLLISVDFPPHKDGISTISRQLSERIFQRGKEVLVIGPRSEGDREFDLSEPYRIFRVAGYEWGYLRFLPFLYWMPFIVWRSRIRKVLAMNIGYGGILSWMLSHFLPLEYLIFAYGYEFEKVKRIPFIRALYLKIYGRAKRIVACSDLVRSRLILFGVAPEKIQVLYPAVDFQKYFPREIPGPVLEEKGLANRQILLTVGRLIERKGHDQVIRSLSRVRQLFPEVLYCIVGVGPYEERLRLEVQSLGLGNHVRFMGEVPDEELALLYNACKVFVMPSREIQKEGHIEGFGIVYLEANACGKPVIGGRSGGVSEAIRDEETGFLVDPANPDEIAEKISRLLSHPEEAERLGQRGLAWVRQKFHWDYYADEVDRILHEEPPLPQKNPLLLISVDFPPHTDGISTAAGELCERIARRGENIMAIGPRAPGDREFDLSQHYPVMRVPGYEWGYLRFVPLFFATLYVVFRYRVRKIFAMSVTYGGVLSWALSFFTPLEYVVFAHGYEFEKVKGIPFLRRFYLKIYGRANGVQVNSRATREKLILFGVPPQKIQVIYAAANLDRYRLRDVPRRYLEEKNLEGRKILLTVGRLIQRKGHDQVLRALPEVLQRFPDLVYCIVGIGPYERNLQREVHRLHLEDHVRFMGKVPDEELVILYNACNVFVMPSREMAERGHIEGFGLVYLEANACARPVIGGRSGGIAEAIQEGETGFLVDPTDPHAIAEKIIFLLSHPEEADRLGRQGLEWVREKFHWDRYVGQVYEMLQGETLP